MADKVQQQSDELANKLWAIANDLRGNMDASKFKNYILGVIFLKGLMRSMWMFHKLKRRLLN